jgi:hypothetical protein
MRQVNPIIPTIPRLWGPEGLVYPRSLLLLVLIYLSEILEVV